MLCLKIISAFLSILDSKRVQSSLAHPHLFQKDNPSMPPARPPWWHTWFKWCLHKDFHAVKSVIKHSQRLKSACMGVTAKSGPLTQLFLSLSCVWHVSQQVSKKCMFMTQIQVTDLSSHFWYFLPLRLLFQNPSSCWFSSLTIWITDVEIWLFIIWLFHMTRSVTENCYICHFHWLLLQQK